MLLSHWRRQSAPAAQGSRDSLQRVLGTSICFFSVMISSTLPTLDSRPQEGVANTRKRSPSPPSPGCGKGSRFDRGKGKVGGCAISSEDEALAEQRDEELQHMQAQRIVKEAASP